MHYRNHLVGAYVVLCEPQSLTIASYPGPSTRKLREREGPGIHCLRMR